MTQTEALKLALEALEDTLSGDLTPYQAAKTITAIKEALANVPTSDTSEKRVDETAKNRHEQEPVAWWNDTGTHIDLNVSGRGIPLYTTPLSNSMNLIKSSNTLDAQRKPLTDEQIRDLCECVPDFDIGTHDLIKFARAIEAKLKEKNT